MKTLSQRFAPHYCSIKRQEGVVSSFRWLGWGWDLIKNRGGGFFLQFGKRPVKFVFLASKTGSPPLFFYDGHWHTKFKLWRIRIGITTRPREIGKLWKRSSKKCHTHKNKNALKIKSTSSSIG